MKRFIGAVSFAVLFLSCFVYGVEPATKYQPQYMQNWSWDETRQAFNVCSLQNSTNTFVVVISSAPGGLNVFINTDKELSVISSSNSIIKNILQNVGVYTSINSTNVSNVMISSAQGGVNVKVNDDKELFVITSTNSNIKAILDGIYVTTIAPVEQRGQWAVSVTSGAIRNTQENGAIITISSIVSNVPILNGAEITISSVILAIPIKNGTEVTISSAINAIPLANGAFVTISSGNIRNTQENGSIVTISSIVAAVPIANGTVVTVSSIIAAIPIGNGADITVSSGNIRNTQENGAQITVSSIVANVTVNNGLAVTVSSITANVGVYVTTAAPILDYDFQNMVSTQVAGQINGNGSFTPDLTVKSYSFIFVGSTGTLGGSNMGDLPLIDGMSINQTFVRGRASQLFQIGLAHDSTMYYIISGGK